MAERPTVAPERPGVAPPPLAEEPPVVAEPSPSVAEPGAPTQEPVAGEEPWFVADVQEPARNEADEGALSFCGEDKATGFGTLSPCRCAASERWE